MIVDPDFLEHWKTRMLIDILGDDAAPLFVIRLWGHCQNRREWVFDGMPIHATKAICRYQGEAQELEDALITCGFLEREGKKITIVGWDEHNASLIANWRNGMRGGRPKKNQGEPKEKPMGIPSDNPSVSDKIGLDRIGVDDIKSGVSDEPPEPAIVLLPTNKFNTEAEEYPVTQKHLDDWQDAYPAVNCLMEAKQAKAWLNANPAKRKTYRGMAKFLNGWMSRQQNAGGSKEPPPPSMPSHRKEMPKPDRPPRRENYG